jgi:hypothetical protein
VLAVWGGENLGLDMEQRIPNKQPCKGEKRMEEGDRDRPAMTSWVKEAHYSD